MCVRVCGLVHLCVCIKKKKKRRRSKEQEMGDCWRETGAFVSLAGTRKTKRGERRGMKEMMDSLQENTGGKTEQR